MDEATSTVMGAPDALRVRAPRRTHLTRDLVIVALVLVAVLAGLSLGGLALYRALYGPSAFVENYLSLLAAGRAADALRVPGVAVDRTDLHAAGLPKNASDALLRRAALGPLTDIRVEQETTEDDEAAVTVSYRTGDHPGTTTFTVHQIGQVAFLPVWGFARSPLSMIDLTVHGSMSFEVNGFHLDKRQTAAGAEVDPAASVPLLVFSPGLYSVRVDTPVSSSPGLAVLADVPLKSVPVRIQTTATRGFVEVVRTKVDAFLTACAAQRVLQPTGCPFGFLVEDRIQAPPVWTITRMPKVTIVPAGEAWAIPAATAVAHIVVDVRSIYDGSIQHVDEDVPFRVAGAIDIAADGSASIRVSSPD